MSESGTKVNPGEKGSAIDIILDKIGLKHWPIYKLAFGDFGTATQVSESNPLPVSPQTQKTAFGEQSVAEPYPLLQADFSYNINEEFWAIRENGGAAATENHQLKISTGASANQSAYVTTKAAAKYNPGQGGLVRFSGLFTAGVAGSLQRMGAGDTTDGFFFGYDGANFGVLRRYGGHNETRKLIITTKSTTAENITITLDGDSDATVAVTDATATDATVTAAEIANHDYSDLGTGWDAHSDGDMVIFVSFDAETHAGAYSLSGATTAVGTVDQTIIGLPPTDDWINQTEWSEDKGDGTGVLPIMDWTKGNVFQIRYQWLGYGMISFYVENSSTGEYICVHKIAYANKNIIPSINNPTLPFCYAAKNTSNTSDIIIRSGSFGMFVEGKINGGGIHNGVSNEKTGIGVIEVPILTIHNSVIYQGTPNRTRVRLIFASASVDSNKSAIIRFRVNASLIGASFSPVEPGSSVLELDTSASAMNQAISLGDEQFTIGLSKTGNASLDLSAADFKLNPGDTLTITGQSASGGTASIVASLNVEDLF